MIYYILVVLFGILAGLSISYSLSYVGRLKIYMRTVRNKNTMYKVLDVLWKILLPLVFSIIGFLIPSDIIQSIFSGIEVKFVLNLYFYSFVISFFIFCFIFIKTGKLKTEKKDSSYEQ